MIRTLALVMLLASGLFGQRSLSGTAQVKLALDRLTNTGSVLMIAAHPDDENTAVLAYYARGRAMRTGYLSLNRGEGGQNLIGPEQGALIGLIRTQELLAARQIDGAEQFFTRAIDFGFSKTVEETRQKWGTDEVLGDVVWIIRQFRPDVIINRFSGTDRDGHGNHQLSALLSKEAFRAAADPARFTEQLRWVQPWQAKRVVWNAFSWNREMEQAIAKQPGVLTLDTGDYNPVLGLSYTEIAGISRSQHRSQAMGSPERKGTTPNYFQHVEGEPAAKDLFDGVDTTWGRVKGAEAASALLAKASREFAPEAPHKSVATLLEARDALAKLDDPIAKRKLAELDEAVALCAGLWLDASAERPSVVFGGDLKVTLTALNRSPLEVSLVAQQAAFGGTGDAAAGGQPALLAFNRPRTAVVTLTGAPMQPSQPYWLRKPAGGALYDVSDRALLGLPQNPAVAQAAFTVLIGGRTLQFVRPVWHRFVDASEGEQVWPVVVVPPVALTLSDGVLLFPDKGKRRVEVLVAANRANAQGEVRLAVPSGWSVTPASVPFVLADDGQRMTLPFEVTPPEGRATAELRAEVRMGEATYSAGMETIRYPHIPPQTVFPAPTAKLIREPIVNLSRRVGYVMGAGDEMPQALRQLGAEVTLLDAEALATSDLSRFDAIVTGVRAYNTRPDLRASQQRLLDFVAQGGTMVVQYNVMEGGFFAGNPTNTARMGPYPIKLSRDRVTVEEAAVTFPSPDHPVLQVPNSITPRDFEGWVQERGLYFPGEWDPRYQPLLSAQDPGEKAMPGGTLYVKHGKGAYIYTAWAWFRQLPAGVPGAYRLFANFLSAGKATSAMAGSGGR